MLLPELTHKATKIIEKYLENEDLCSNMDLNQSDWHPRK